MNDVTIVLCAKAVRTLCYGYLGVLFPVYVVEHGLPSAGLGVAVTLTLASTAAFTFAARRPAARSGPRPVLMALSVAIVASAMLFLATDHVAAIVLAAMLGNLAVGIGEAGPFLALEQVVVSRGVERDDLARTMSVYNLVGYISAAAGSALVARWLRTPSTLFLLFLCSGLAQLALYSQLRHRAPDADVHENAGPPRSGPLVRRLGALFALDSLAGGLVVQSLLAHWFRVRFGLSVDALFIVFGTTQLLSGLSLLVAPWLSRRLGLVNTMVFSHLISNLFLIGVAVAPAAPVAIGLLFARHLLSQIDVPTRQTFLMLVVPDDERESAATFTTMTRTVAQACSPMVAGWAMHGAWLAAPLIAGGALKIVYDLALWMMIRRAEDAARTPGAP
ncbi:MAG: MFS transporter [Chloroflexota bacterium]